LRLLRNLGTGMFTEINTQEITEKGVRAINANGEEVFFEADNVVISVGVHANEEYTDSFYYAAERVVKAGDCMGKMATIHNAVSSGYDMASACGVK